MTPLKEARIWELIIATRHYRAINPIHHTHADGWTPLTLAEMHYAMG
jgi:hypothetical protein